MECLVPELPVDGDAELELKLEFEVGQSVAIVSWTCQLPLSYFRYPTIKVLDKETRRVLLFENPKTL